MLKVEMNICFVKLELCFHFCGKLLFNFKFTYMATQVYTISQYFLFFYHRYHIISYLPPLSHYLLYLPPLSHYLLYLPPLSHCLIFTTVITLSPIFTTVITLSHIYLPLLSHCLSYLPPFYLFSYHLSYYS